MELLAARVCAVALALFGEGDAGRLRQRTHGFGKRHTILLHEEGERVAAHAAPEAMEDALLGIHREGRGLLGVERAQALVVDPRLPQIHEAADELDDVDASADLVEEGG